jgi:regulation of enolase protein 1 (concanavalin A-like superfamily)
MKNTLDLSPFSWINPPEHYEVLPNGLSLQTDPGTDFWQRTYYGFRNDNAPAFLLPLEQTEFSFGVTAAWQPQNLFDQCGVALYQDSDNWFKASVEYDNPHFSRLGSVVTNLGYSDWATTDISSAQTHMSYRLSRRGQDFLIENAPDGQTFQQMRIFHMHQPIARVRLGVYACSPLKSSMAVRFSDFWLGPCQWQLHTP